MNPESLMSEDERYVRARWEESFLRSGMFNDGSEAFCFVVNGEEKYSGWYKSKSEAWAAARAFTEAREREIADLREEIAYFWYLGKEDITRVPQRIVGRLREILAEKLKGWKQ